MKNINLQLNYPENWDDIVDVLDLWFGRFDDWFTSKIKEIFNRIGRDVWRHKTVTVFLIIIFVGLFWKVSLTTAIFWVFFLALVWYKWDSRIAAGLALAALAVCPFLIIWNKPVYAETVAIWAYYLLVITVIAQIIEMRRQERGLNIFKISKMQKARPADLISEDKAVLENNIKKEINDERGNNSDINLNYLLPRHGAISLTFSRLEKLAESIISLAPSAVRRIKNNYLSAKIKLERIGSWSIEQFKSIGKFIFHKFTNTFGRISYPWSGESELKANEEADKLSTKIIPIETDSADSITVGSKEEYNGLENDNILLIKKGKGWIKFVAWAVIIISVIGCLFLIYYVLRNNSTTTIIRACLLIFALLVIVSMAIINIRNRD